MDQKAVASTGRLVAGVLALQTSNPGFAQTGAPGPEVSTLRELGPALTRCWRPPEGTAGAQLTVVLSLNRDGAVMGQPRISYAKLPKEQPAARSFVSAALASLATCTPVRLSPGLGGAVAGRPLSIRFQGWSHPAPERRAQLG